MSTNSGPAGHRGPYRGAAALAIDGHEPWSLERLIDTDGGRWSRSDEATIYLASDPGVALAEFGRHVPGNGARVDGALWTVDVALEDIVDLRDTSDVDLLDQGRCRAIAAAWRRAGVPGLIVPSVAFLDHPDRFNLVVFPDLLGSRLSDVIRSPQRLAAIVQESRE